MPSAVPPRRRGDAARGWVLRVTSRQADRPLGQGGRGGAAPRYGGRRRERERRNGPLSSETVALSRALCVSLETGASLSSDCRLSESSGSISSSHIFPSPRSPSAVHPSPRSPSEDQASGSVEEAFPPCRPRLPSVTPLPIRYYSQVPQPARLGGRAAVGVRGRGFDLSPARPSCRTCSRSARGAMAARE